MFTNTIGTARVTFSNCATDPLPMDKMTSGASVANSAAYLRVLSSLPPTDRGVDLQVAAVGPAQLLQHLQEQRDVGLTFRIVRGCAREHADAPHPLGLLCPRRERQSRRPNA